MIKRLSALDVILSEVIMVSKIEGSAYLKLQMVSEKNGLWSAGNHIQTPDLKYASNNWLK